MSRRALSAQLLWLLSASTGAADCPQLGGSLSISGDDGGNVIMVPPSVAQFGGDDWTM